MKTSVPSNTFIVFGSFGLAFLLALYAYHLQTSQPRLAAPIGIAGFCLVFFGTAAAQLRSGYFWRNLSPGNRGQHRSAAPGRFYGSVALHLALGLLILALAAWCYTSPS